MNRPPKYVQGFIDRHGKGRFYFRRAGFAKVALPGLPWSPEFMQAYERAMAGQPAPTATRSSLIKVGSFRALAVSYYQSPAFRSMNPRTQRVYRNVIEGLCEQRDKNGDKIGNYPVALLKREHIVRLMAAKFDKPEAANMLRRVLRAMMKHGIETGLRQDDPTRDVKAVKSKGQGAHSWSEDEIAQFETCHAIGSRARLGFALLLHTGQRRSDVVRMGRQHIRDGAIHLRQKKTGAELAIPLHPSLVAIITDTPAAT